ncbi:cytochrome P450 [Fomitopsis betulina]|nr:cytochrome P450 [Fomitopsis betulina]
MQAGQIVALHTAGILGRHQNQNKGFQMHYYRQQHPLHNIPGPRPKSFITGNMSQFFGSGSIPFQHDIVKSFATRPMLYIYDPKALHAVLVRDSDNYEQSGRLISINKALVGPGWWLQLRKMLNPIFTAHRMRCLLPICYDIGFTLYLQADRNKLDILSWTTRIALEAIGRSGLGHSFDALVDDRRLHRGLYSARPSISRLEQWMGVVPFIHRIPMPIRQCLSLFSTIKAGHELRLVMDAVITYGKRIADARKLALQDGDVDITNQTARGDDFMSTLMKANMAASEEIGYPRRKSSPRPRNATSNYDVLLVTATDTTASTLARNLELLAHYPVAQERLRTEAITVRDGDVTLAA